MSGTSKKKAVPATPKGTPSTRLSSRKRVEEAQGVEEAKEQTRTTSPEQPVKVEKTNLELGLEATEQMDVLIEEFGRSVYGTGPEELGSVVVKESADASPPRQGAEDQDPFKAEGAAEDVSLAMTHKEGPSSIFSFEETQALTVPPPSYELGEATWNALDTGSRQLFWEMHKKLNPDSAEEVQQSCDYFANKRKMMERQKKEQAKTLFQDEHSTRMLGYEDRLEDCARKIREKISAAEKNAEEAQKWEDMARKLRARSDHD